MGLSVHLIDTHRSGRLRRRVDSYAVDSMVVTDPARSRARPLEEMQLGVYGLGPEEGPTFFPAGNQAGSSH